MMVISLNEKFLNVSCANQVKNNNFLSFTSESVKQTENKPENKNNTGDYIKKYVIPLGLVTSGAVLVYFGLKKPHKDLIFDKAIEQKISEMKEHLSDFKNFVNETINNSFKGADNYLRTYQENYSYNIVPELSLIRIEKTPKEILKKYRSAMEKLSQIQSSENNRSGVTIFDKFLGSMISESKDVSGVLWNKRCEKGMKCEDLIHFVFNDYGNPEKMSHAKGKLMARKYLIDLDMDLYRDKAIKDAFNMKSKPMSKAIMTSRRAYVKAKEDILEASFESLRKALNLPETFTPNYNKASKLKGIVNLNTEDLKPQKFTPEILELYSTNPVVKFIASKDLSNITKTDLQRLYHSLSFGNNIKDILMIADYVRLQNEVDKALGKNNESLHQNVIAKLEYLSEKMHELGNEEIMKISNEEYYNLSSEAMKSKFARLNRASQKMGFPTLKDMEDYYIQRSKHFASSQVREYLSLVEKSPELYFS